MPEFGDPRLQIEQGFISYANSTISGSLILTTGSIIFPDLTSQSTAAGSGPNPEGGGSPGGDSGQIQYNNNGAFGGVTNLTWDGTTLLATGSFSGSLVGTGSWSVSSSRAITSSFALTASMVPSYEGAWISYTPSWTAASSNPAINNGTLEGWYKIVGKTCFVRGNIAMGTTTTFGSGEWYVSMPFTASHADAILMTANLLDNGSAWYNAVVNGARAGFNYKAPLQFQTSSGTANDVNATQPFTWANSDRFLWNGSYEIA
jgi:hypothetical protein